MMVAGDLPSGGSSSRDGSRGRARVRYREAEGSSGRDASAFEFQPCLPAPVNDRRGSIDSSEYGDGDSGGGGVGFCDTDFSADSDDTVHLSPNTNQSHLALSFPLLPLSVLRKRRRSELTIDGGGEDGGFEADDALGPGNSVVSDWSWVDADGERSSNVGNRASDGSHLPPLPKRRPVDVAAKVTDPEAAGFVETTPKSWGSPPHEVRQEVRSVTAGGGRICVDAAVQTVESSAMQSNVDSGGSSSLRSRSRPSKRLLLLRTAQMLRRDTMEVKLLAKRLLASLRRVSTGSIPATPSLTLLQAEGPRPARRDSNSDADAGPGDDGSAGRTTGHPSLVVPPRRRPSSAHKARADGRAATPSAHLAERNSSGRSAAVGISRLRPLLPRAGPTAPFPDDASPETPTTPVLATNALVEPYPAATQSYIASLKARVGEWARRRDVPWRRRVRPTSSGGRTLALEEIKQREFELQKIDELRSLAR
ncbi:hypothetical protein HK405_014077, partial [Cladochytrium tenue]